MNDATAQMGMQFGKSAVAAGQDYVEKNVRPASSPSPTPANPSCPVLALPPPPARENLLLRHKLLRPAQAPAHPLPLAAQPVGAAAHPGEQDAPRGRAPGSHGRSGERGTGRVDASPGGYQCAGPVYPEYVPECAVWTRS
jgi:hypothetical protein